jgi:hypothetical protein
VILVDTNVLYALADRRDKHHARCADWLQRTPDVLMIPATVLAETCYLIDRTLGPAAEAAFLDSVGMGPPATSSSASPPGSSTPSRKSRPPCGPPPGHAAGPAPTGHRQGVRRRSTAPPSGIAARAAAGAPPTSGRTSMTGSAAEPPGEKANLIKVQDRTDPSRSPVCR